MNRQAVALAADSAVTVRSQVGGKAWQSANKIFGLSRHHSIGVMVYGQAELLGLPWETVIKSYRDQLAEPPFGTVREYADDLISFIASNSALFPESVQVVFTQNRVGSLFLLMREEMVQAVDDATRELERDVTQAETMEIVSRVIDHHHVALGNQPYYEGLTAAFERTLRSKYKAAIDQAKRDIFQELPLTSGQSRKLTSIGVRALTHVIQTVLMSGIVVAGFGADEVFPNLESLLIEGMTNGKLMLWREEASVADRESPSNVRAFAQSDMAVSFMEGIEPKYRETLDQLAGKIFRYYPVAIIDNIDSLTEEERKKLKEGFEKVADATLESFQVTLQSYRASTFTEPIVQVVSMLPKDELASMAEALVNLTSFRQKISMQLESVGGPIDVALISKGDGFVWVKRKNYFDLAQNPHFMARYLAS